MHMFTSSWKKYSLLGIAAIAITVVACTQTEARTDPTPTLLAGSPVDQPISEISDSAGHIWLEAPIGDYQTGWATLTETGDGLRVELDLTPAEPVAQPAHIHVGTFDQMGAVVYPLENVIGGRSVSELPGLTVEEIASGEYAMYVHFSFADFKTFTACGEIPALP